MRRSERNLDGVIVLVRGPGREYVLRNERPCLVGLPSIFDLILQPRSDIARIYFLRVVAAGQKLTAAQAKKIVGLFRGTEAKIFACTILYETVQDEENWATTLSILPTVHDADRVANLLGMGT